MLLKMLRAENAAQRRARRPPSSTARASRAPRKGRRGLIRSASMRPRNIKGVKRHIATDTQGFLLNAIVHPANVHGSRWRRRSCSSELKQLFPGAEARLGPDNGYNAKKLTEAFKASGELEARDREALRHGESASSVLPRRCGGGRARWPGWAATAGLAKHFECLAASCPRLPQARHDPTSCCAGLVRLLKNHAKLWKCRTVRRSSQRLPFGTYREGIRSGRYRSADVTRKPDSESTYVAQVTDGGWVPHGNWTWCGARILKGARACERDVLRWLGRRSGGSSGRLVIADLCAFLPALWSRAAHVIELGTVRVSGRDDERTTCIRRCCQEPLC